MLKGYIIISILLIADLILYLTNGISISGQILDKVLFWIWLIFTPIVITKYFNRKWTKWYLGIIGSLIITSLIPMGIPFLTITAFAIGTDNEREIENFSLREGARSVIAIPKIRLIKTIGILEKEIGETDLYIEIEEDNYRLADFDEIDSKQEGDSLRIEFKIGNQVTKRKIEIK